MGKASDHELTVGELIKRLRYYDDDLVVHLSVPDFLHDRNTSLRTTVRRLERESFISDSYVVVLSDG
jgi:hypothetical protein